MRDNQATFFSIVIPTYNRATYIPATLDSIFSQTYPHYEIVIVDNCSTDNTEEVLQPLIEAEKIRFIKHERNYERARSRNTGMENSTGDFVTLLDSDDFMYPDNLTDAAEFIKANPQIKCFHNLYELIDADKKVLRDYKFPSLKNRLKAIASGNFMSCIGNFIHRDIYQKYRFDTYQQLTGAEDWEFWLRVIADYEVGRIEKVNNGVLHHENRTVQSQNLSILEEGNRYLIEKFKNDEHLSNVYQSFLERMYANSYLYLAILANGGKLFKEARQYLQKAVEKDASIILTSRFARVLRRTAFKL